MTALAIARWDMDTLSEPTGYEGAILEARLRGDPFASQLTQDLEGLRASLGRSLPRYWARRAPSATAGTALRAVTVASVAALAAAVTGNLYVAGGLVMAGMLTVPQPARAHVRPRRSRREKSVQTNWRAQLERECLDQVLDGYRTGQVPARAALPSYTARVDWNRRHGVQSSEYQALLMEAIEVARDAGDALGLMRLQARTEHGEGLR
jgi:hypothetical protein